MFHEGDKDCLIHLYSVIRLKIQTYLCKNVVNKNTLRKHYLGMTLIQKGIIIFAYNDKQIILLTSMRNNNPKLQYTEKKKIPKHNNTIWEE